MDSKNLDDFNVHLTAIVNHAIAKFPDSDEILACSTLLQTAWRQDRFTVVDTCGIKLLQNRNLYLMSYSDFVKPNARENLKNIIIRESSTSKKFNLIGLFGLLVKKWDSMLPREKETDYNIITGHLKKLLSIYITYKKSKMSSRGW